MQEENNRRGELEPKRDHGGSPGSPPASASGVDALIAGVSSCAFEALARGRSTSWFVRTIAAQYAYIMLEDMRRPWQFLRQMAGAPPLQLGVDGFRPEVVDDRNPARHYTAFVFVGFHLPGFSAKLALWLWEIAGFIRYRGKWSWPDMANGRIGIAHGRLVRRYGPTVLPGLIAYHLAKR